MKGAHRKKAEKKKEEQTNRVDRRASKPAIKTWFADRFNRSFNMIGESMHETAIEVTVAATKQLDTSGKPKSKHVKTGNSKSKACLISVCSYSSST